MTDITVRSVMTDTDGKSAEAHDDLRFSPGKRDTVQGVWEMSKSSNSTKSNKAMKWAAGIVAIAAATGSWFAGGETALAPEPVRTTAPLYGSNGATAAAVYVNTSIETTVTQWPGSYTVGSIPAGTPCATYPLAVGQETSMVIVATGSYRKCQ